MAQVRGGNIFDIKPQREPKKKGTPVIKWPGLLYWGMGIVAIYNASKNKGHPLNEERCGGVRQGLDRGVLLIFLGQQESSLGKRLGIVRNISSERKGAGRLRGKANIEAIYQHQYLLEWTGSGKKIGVPPQLNGRRRET